MIRFGTKTNMADVDNNNVIMEVTSHDGLDENGVVETTVDGNIGEQVDGDVCEEDILQQALVEASETFADNVQIQYPESVALQEGGILTTGDEGVAFTITSGDGSVNSVQMSESFENGNYQVLAAVPDGTQETFSSEPLPNGHPAEHQVQVLAEDSLEYVNINEQNAEVEKDGQLVAHQVVDNPGPITVATTISQQTMQLIQSGLAPPLGSSQNPIRIIQQGNQYTPVQQLTPEQLQQIMQVVQQQQVAQNVETGSSVLFNPQTNTRIVYRVIYPSELHKDGSGDRSKMKGQETMMQSTPKKVYKKRLREDDQERIDGPELSKEEKEMKKKMRAKTRSGRISKPPKHMVKDFKHIHVLDYEEDYDDSDGGYSDYKVEAEEEDDDDKSKKEDDDAYIAPGLNSIKPKNYKCITCDKAYIGKAGLGRHLKLYPSHGYLDPDGDGEMEPPPPVTGDEATPLTPITPNGMNSTANSTASLSEDSHDSSYSLPYTPTPTVTKPRGTGQRGRPRGSRSGGWRGRGAYYKIDPETRRRNKLKEVTRDCTDEDLMEIVLPRLAKVITLWEFLLMKVEKGDPAWPHADDIYIEYEKLHQHVKKLCQEYLQFVPESREMEKEPSLLQVNNTVVADALGLKVGHHKVKEILDTDSDITYKYKFLTTNHNVDIDYNNRSILKRTVEVVSPDQIVSQNKKPRNSSIKPSVTILPASVAAQALNTVNSVNKSSNIANATTSVLMTNSLPQTPILIQTSTPQSKVQLVGHGSSATNTGIVSQNTFSGRTTGSKAVSLLNKPITKHLPSSQKKSPSQKFIIISGTNGSEEVSVEIPMSSASHLSSSNVNTVQQAVITEQKLVLPTAPTISSQAGTSHFISSDHSEIGSDKVILQNSGSGVYTFGNASVPQVGGTLPVSSSQPVVVAIPQSPSQPQILQNIIVNDLGVIKSQNDDLVTAIPDSTAKVNSVGSVNELINSGHVLKSLSSVTNFLQNVSDLPLTNNNTCQPPNIGSETSPAIMTSASNDLNSHNVVYSFHNGDSAQNSDVYPDMMLVTKQEVEPIHSSTNADSVGVGVDTKVLLSNDSGGEVVGVINSIDPTAASTHVKQEPARVDISMAGPQQFEEQSHMAAMETSEVQDEDNKPQLVQYQTVMDNPDQADSIQVPATNIFQTEDGIIIIQNPDGTTVQLQGSDGQPISMETVQALLAMDGETQFITEQPDAMEEQ